MQFFFMIEIINLFSNLLQMHLKLLQKKIIQKPADATRNLICNIITKKFIRELHHRIVRGHLHMRQKIIGLNREIARYIHISRKKAADY